MKDRLLVVAVVVPLLGLLALIGRAEFNLQDGRPWLLPIRGYDPRDLISGHYLRFTYDLHPQPSTCGAPPARDARSLRASVRPERPRGENRSSITRSKRLHLTARPRLGRVGTMFPLSIDRQCAYRGTKWTGGSRSAS